jgi:Tfp pilus assembly protein PilE
MNRHRTHHSRGLTLIEAMLLVIILSIVAVAAGVGLQAVAKVPAQTDLTLAINNALVDTLEQWRAKSWATMTSANDTVTINSKSYARAITVEDADPTATNDPTTFTAGSTQTDFRRITATINGQIMRVYVAKP